MRTFVLVALVCAIAYPAKADWNTSVTLASEYLFKGYPMSNGRPALQAEVSWQQNQWFGGVWGSNTDFFNQLADSHVSAEMDLYFGRSWPVSTAGQCSSSLWRYQYYGGSGASQVDYAEIQLSCSRNSSQILVAWSPAYGATDNQHSILTWRQQLGQVGPLNTAFELSSLHNLDDQQFYQRGQSDNYQYLAFTASYQVQDMVWRLTLGTENDSAAMGKHIQLSLDLSLSL